MDVIRVEIKNAVGESVSEARLRNFKGFFSFGEWRGNGFVSILTSELGRPDILPLLNKLSGMHSDRAVAKIELEITPKLTFEEQSTTKEELEAVLVEYWKMFTPAPSGSGLFTKVNSALLELQPAKDNIKILSGVRFNIGWIKASLRDPSDNGLSFRIDMSEEDKQLSVVVVQHTKGHGTNKELSRIMRKEADLVVQAVNTIVEAKKPLKKSLVY